MREIPTSVKNCLKRHEVLGGLFGEIYLTSKFRLIFHCTFCAESFDTILAYKKHALTNHQNKVGLVEDEQIAEEEEIADSSSDKEKKQISNCNDGKDPLEGNDTEIIQSTIEISNENLKIEQFAEEEELIITTDRGKKPNKEEADSLINPEISKCNTIEIIEFSITKEKANEIRNKQTSKRTFQCDECNECYEHKQSLSNHKRTHSKRLKHSCTQCNKKFTQDNDFKMHILWHSGERPYICSWCGKDYRTVRALHIHERLHTNTRPYKCPYCERDFYKNRHLKEHIVTHTRERNHMCHICNSSFPRRKALKSHIKIHENKREHVCNICEAAYNQRPALYFHMKNKHNVLPLTTSITAKTEKNKTIA